MDVFDCVNERCVIVWCRGVVAEVEVDDGCGCGSEECVGDCEFKVGRRVAGVFAAFNRVELSCPESASMLVTDGSGICVCCGCHWQVGIGVFKPSFLNEESLCVVFVDEVGNSEDFGWGQCSRIP